MNNPLLSIAIPTFNRKDCLKECLESIFSQFSDQNISNLVEVVISDNASTDGTEQIIEEYKKKYQQITYKKNPVNFGVDKNILQVAEMSAGKYIWFLGDDDALFSDALLTVLNILKTEKADYLIVNCWGYDKSLTDKAVNKPNILISENQYYASLKEYVVKAPHNNSLVGMFCGLSMQIFLKVPWERLANKDRFIGTNAVHMHSLMLAMKNRKFGLIAKPCVKVRADNIRWEVFEGLENTKKRALLTQQALVWILNEYSIRYSKLRLRIIYLNGIIFDELRLVLRKYILTNQKSRDMLKKILGKL